MHPVSTKAFKDPAFFQCSEPAKRGEAKTLAEAGEFRPTQDGDRLCGQKCRRGASGHDDLLSSGEYRSKKSFRNTKTNWSKTRIAEQIAQQRCYRCFTAIKAAWGASRESEEPESDRLNERTVNGHDLESVLQLS
jgi:hypothetical protein